MKLEGNLAVVTGTGDGMGRELVIGLARQGCSVATCDVNLDAAEETRKLAENQASGSFQVPYKTVPVFTHRLPQGPGRLQTTSGSQGTRINLRPRQYDSLLTGR